MTEALLLRIIHVPDMITVNEILDPIVLLLDHTDTFSPILVLDTDHVLIQDITILQDILLHSGLLQNQEIRDIPDPAPNLIQGTKLIQYKYNQQMTPFNLKYACTTMHKKLMRWHQPVGFTYYIHLLPKDTIILITHHDKEFSSFRTLVLLSQYLVIQLIFHLQNV